jgi:hypothetical protein
MSCPGRTKRRATRSRPRVASRIRFDLLSKPYCAGKQLNPTGSCPLTAVFLGPKGCLNERHITKLYSLRNVPVDLLHQVDRLYAPWSADSVITHSSSNSIAVLRSSAFLMRRSATSTPRARTIGFARSKAAGPRRGTITARSTALSLGSNGRSRVGIRGRSSLGVRSRLTSTATSSAFEGAT